MTKTLKLLSLATVISVLCGFFTGLVRAEKLFSNPYPSFYIVFILSAVFLTAIAYIISLYSKAEGRENLTLYESADNAKLSSDSHTLLITVILLFGAGLVAISAIRSFLTSNGSTIENINFVFADNITRVIENALVRPSKRHDVSITEKKTVALI